ncbi:MAG: hypothetical protein AB7E55_29320 [Pigmentiphaga sp.]
MVTSLGPLVLRNPIGLSAGFDKNAEALLGLQELGFGYLTVGSILPQWRKGNDKPRLVRLPESSSLLNCYGLPSHGRETCGRRLTGFARIKSAGTVVVANVDAPSIEEYLKSVVLIQDSVDAIELGLQCPNNREDAGDMHEPASFEALVRRTQKVCRKPVFVKFGFADSAEALENRMLLTDIAVRYGVAAIVVPGIRKVQDSRLSIGVGAISGKAAFARNLEVVQSLSDQFGSRISIKSNGGVFDGRDAFAVLKAGASAIDLFTAFIYRGWGAPRLITHELLSVLDSEGVDSLAALRRPAR